LTRAAHFDINLLIILHIQFIDELLPWRLLFPCQFYCATGGNTPEVSRNEVEGNLGGAKRNLAVAVGGSFGA